MKLYHVLVLMYPTGIRVTSAKEDYLHIDIKVPLSSTMNETGVGGNSAYGEGFLDLTILLDTTSSNFSELREVAADFCERLIINGRRNELTPEWLYVSVFPFNNSVSQLNISNCPFEDHACVEAKIKLLQKTSGTPDLEKAIKMAIERTDAIRRIRAANLWLVVTDTVPSDRIRSLAPKIHRLRGTIYTVTSKKLEKGSREFRAFEMLTFGEKSVFSTYHIDVVTVLHQKMIADCKDVLFRPLKLHEYGFFKNKLRLASIISAVLLLFVILVAGAGAYWRWRYYGLRQIRIMEMSSFDLTENDTDQWELKRNELVVFHDQVIGSGAFGKVCKGLIARESGPQITVAIKLLPDHCEEISREEFRKEINLMKELGHHPHVVSIVGCVTSSSPLYVAVEFCSDGDLHTVLRTAEKELTLEQILSFSWQVADGLLYISEKGFIHRDVAARNVMIHEGTIAKVGDFGLCRYIYGSTTSYMSSGGRLPLKWMAPESLEFNEFSTASDVWSFGILIYELTSRGGAPLPTVHPEDLQSFLKSGNRPKKPNQCPEYLFEISQKCWHLVPGERPSFSELRKMLGELLEEATGSSNYYTTVENTYLFD